ncbi:MAG: hypothetical protein ABSB60_13205 [Terracidiphilus sp.]
MKSMQIASLLQVRADQIVQIVGKFWGDLLFRPIDEMKQDRPRLLLE